MATSDKKLKAKKAALRATPEEDPEFQIAPMIDVLLVLMVFFMSISSAEVLKNVKGIELPVAEDAKAKEDQIPGEAVINVTWNRALNSGSVAIGETHYASVPELRAPLMAGVNKNPMIRVLVRADTDTKYQFLREIMQVVGDVRINNITFSVVNREGAQQQAAELDRTLER